MQNNANFTNDRASPKSGDETYNSFGVGDLRSVPNNSLGNSV